MIVNGPALFVESPINFMCYEKKNTNGISFGLSEAGYDIRIKQSVVFSKKRGLFSSKRVVSVDGEESSGKFCLASSVERFSMPNTLLGVVHDKSSWARRGLSVFNTVIEPGWGGWLTLELVYHGDDELVIHAGTGIAQVLFHQVKTPASYEGKYQHQGDFPVEAKGF